MESWVGPAVTATIISSVIAVVGWFVAYGSARRIEREKRREKVRDFQVALLAEIRSEGHHLAKWDFDADLVAVNRNYREAEMNGGAYVPLVARPAGPILFQSLLPEIHVLPEQIIDPVMLFFRQEQLIERFVEDLRSDAFRALEPSRQQRMYADYIDMMRYWKTLADHAEAALRKSLAAHRAPSSEDGGRSARRSASASARASDRASSKSPSHDI